MEIVMFGTNFTLAASLLLSTSVTGGEDLNLEPCINGQVSSQGVFPTQIMEDQITAYLEWSAAKGNPYYLFSMVSKPVMGADSRISRALPCGNPSTISTRTISA